MSRKVITLNEDILPRLNRIGNNPDPVDVIVLFRSIAYYLMNLKQIYDSEEYMALSLGLTFMDLRTGSSLHFDIRNEIRIISKSLYEIGHAIDLEPTRTHTYYRNRLNKAAGAAWRATAMAHYFYLEL